MATDYESGLIARLWAIFEGSADFTGVVRPGNRIKYDKPNAADPYKTNVAPGDLPEVEIDVRMSEWSGYSDDEVYGENASYDPAAGTSAWLETTHLALTITITGKDTRLDPNNQLARAIMRDIRAAGPTLGLSWVARWGRVHRQDVVDNAGKYARGGWRRITTILLPVTIQVQGNQELS